MIAKLGPPPAGPSEIFGDPREENLLFRVATVRHLDKHPEDADEAVAICDEMIAISSKQNTYAGLASYGLKKVGGIHYAISQGPLVLPLFFRETKAACAAVHQKRVRGIYEKFFEGRRYFLHPQPDAVGTDHQHDPEV